MQHDGAPRHPAQLAQAGARSAQWWSERIAIAASNAPSANGSASGDRVDHGAAPGGRCARITGDGSTAVTARSRGS